MGLSIRNGGLWPPPVRPGFSPALPHHFSDACARPSFATLVLGNTATCAHQRRSFRGGFRHRLVQVRWRKPPLAHNPRPPNQFSDRAPFRDALKVPIHNLAPEAPEYHRLLSERPPHTPPAHLYYASKTAKLAPPLPGELSGGGQAHPTRPDLRCGGLLQREITAWHRSMRARTSRENLRKRSAIVRSRLKRGEKKRPNRVRPAVGRICPTKE